MLNENLLKGKWKEIKGDIQKAWGKLTDDELEEAKGDANSLAGLVQRKYGIAQEEARTKLNKLAERFTDTKEERQEKEARPN